MLKFTLPPKQKLIIPPADGWLENTWYIVEASFATTNPIHDYVFFTGFLSPASDPANYNNEGNPAGYNHFDTEGQPEFCDVHYLKAGEPIATETSTGIKSV